MVDDLQEIINTNTKCNNKVDIVILLVGSTEYMSGGTLQVLSL